MNTFLILFGAIAALIIAVGWYITRGTGTQDGDHSGAPQQPQDPQDDATFQR